MNQKKQINVKLLCSELFKDNKGKPFKIYPYQVEIIKTILLKLHRKTTCKATTRAGKSEAVALACILSAMYMKNEKILIIAPTADHAKIIMGYVANHLIDNERIINSLDFDLGSNKAERVKKEISKKKLTFKTGSSIEIKSATITQGGRSLIGEGGSIIIIDETALIPEEIYRTAILRMLGDRTDSILFEIGNPISRNHFQEHHQDPEWHKLTITWKDCVREGRLTQDFIDSQRNSLLPIEFQMWYDAEFPTEAEDSIFKEAWINRAIKLYIQNKDTPIDTTNEINIGCDIARYGADLTVHTIVEKKDEFWIIREIKSFGEKSTMATVGDIIELERIYKPNRIKIDEGRYGGALVDRLKEKDIGDKIDEIAFGSSPVKDKKRFLNKKAEMFWNLRDLFEKGMLAIPRHTQLIKELLKMRFEFTSNGKIRVLDYGMTSQEVGKSKSPDHADSLALALYSGGYRIAILEGTDVIF